jgi:hypothetical protein
MELGLPLIQSIVVARRAHVIEREKSSGHEMLQEHNLVSNLK